MTTTIAPPTLQDLRPQLGELARILRFRARSLDYHEDQIAEFDRIAASAIEAISGILAACESTTKESFEAGMQAAFKSLTERAYALQEGKSP